MLRGKGYKSPHPLKHNSIIKVHVKYNGLQYRCQAVFKTFPKFFYHAGAVSIRREHANRGQGVGEGRKQAI